MNLREVDPAALSISEMNERDQPPITEDFEESVEKQGTVQPPVVRPNGDGLEVVIGQRRKTAAERVGLDTIPVVVVEWDDADALMASITENVDAFREGVIDGDRAAAIERLMDLTGMTQPEVAEELGVDRSTVRLWMEPAREEWQGTDGGHKRPNAGTDQPSNGNDTRNDSDIYSGASEAAADATESVGAKTLQNVRKASEGADDPGQARDELKHRAAKGELTQRDTAEIAKAVDRGADPAEAADRVADSKDTSGSTGGTIGVQLTLPGDVSDRLTDRAETEGVSNEEVIRRALRQYLGISE